MSSITAAAVGVSRDAERALRGELVEVGRLLYARGLVVATDGNISARLAADRILATPSGLCKGRMAPEQLIVVDMGGKRVDRPTAANAGLAPTSEIHMHLEAYRRRPDIGAVVHAHPPHAVALSIARIPLGPCLLPEAIVFLGLPPTTPYATPSSPEGAAAIREAIAGHDALVLARHGSLAVGARPLAAFHNTETLEQLARITFMLHLLGVDAAAGAGASLAPSQIGKLLAAREGLGLARAEDPAEFCAVCGVCHPIGGPKVDGADAERIRAIVARVIAALDNG